MIKAVLFDMDGVLFDTENLCQRRMIENITAMGFAGATEEFYHTTLGIPYEDCRRLYMAHFGPAFPFDEYMRVLHEQVTELCEREGLPRKDGLMECLTGLKARGLKISLVSSTQRWVVERYFAAMPDVAACFDAKVCGGEVPNGKPAPDMYLKGAEVLGVRPEECVGVEDSYSGVQAVHAARCHCVMIPDLLPFSDRFAPFVDDRLSTLRELCPLIDRMNGAQ